MGLLAFQAYCLREFFDDQRDLSRLMDGIASRSAPPSVQAQRIVDFLRPLPSDTNQSYYLLPALGFLRATPREVADLGGDCADRSRLVVTLLRLRGIEASKWAIYTPLMIPRHAVVEVESEQGKMVVDPLFGLDFPRPGGGFYGIEDLRRDPSILRSRVEQLRSEYLRPGADPLYGYPLDEYVYTYARSINWDKLVITRLLYRALHSIVGDRVDRLPRPEWVERPSLVVIAGIGLLELAFLFFWSFIQWRWRSPRARAGVHLTRPNGSAEYGTIRPA